MKVQLRLIQAKDNVAMAQVIRCVSAECGLGASDGFAVGDAVLDDLYAVYTQPKAAYWVVVDEQDQVLGGGGVSALQGCDGVLEVQKMYFLPEVRGQGWAKQILQRCFEWGHGLGCSQFYLETTASLGAAVGLYERMGFVRLDAPLGQTGHSDACEIYMLKTH